MVQPHNGILFSQEKEGTSGYNMDESSSLCGIWKSQTGKATRCTIPLTLLSGYVQSGWRGREGE